ncbi:MAG: histidine kinase, partial [Chloroflexota bacterium]|nr:histidine kinase [Chloroflexota bacterium]
AGATEARVSLLRSSPGMLTLSIADNGRGLPHNFDLAGLAGGGHYGVLGISERVALVEGHFQLENHSGGGVALHAEIPVPKLKARAATV